MPVRQHIATAALALATGMGSYAAFRVPDVPVLVVEVPIAPPVVRETIPIVRDSSGESPFAETLSEKLENQSPGSRAQLDAILATGDSESRATMLKLFIRQLDAAHPGAIALASAAHSHLADGHGLSAMEDFAGRSAEAQPEPTLAWAEALSPGELRERVLEETFKATHWEHPDLLFDYLNRTSEKSTMWRFHSSINEALGSLVRNGRGRDAVAQLAQFPGAQTDMFVSTAVRWLRKDPEPALAFLDLAPESVLAEIGNRLANNIVKGDPDAAAGYLKRLDNPGLRSLLVEEITTARLDQDVGSATRWWATLPPDVAAASREIYLRVGLNTNPQRIAEFASIHPELLPDARSYRKITGVWMELDPEAASDWATSLPAGPGRDHAAEGIANALTWGEDADREAALKWAESISDPAHREAALADLKIPESFD